MANHRTIFTIGHSNHSLETFLKLLRARSVSAIADVRSAPYSRYCPHFNKDSLTHSLREHGIDYVFLGQELGGRSNDPSCYDNDGKVLYGAVAKTPMFRSGIERLKKGANKHRITIMCAEREPLECHRTLLVSQALVDEHLNVQHIHGDGQVEPHAEAIERLLDLVGLPHEDLFHTRKELLMEARAQQEKRIAFKGEDSSTVPVREAR